MRISPASYHMVPRATARSCPGTSDEHDISPDCPVRCLSAAIGHPAFPALTRALSDQFPARVPTAGDVAALYRNGELAALPGIGPRHLAGIERGLFIAGLITRRDQLRRLRGKAGCR